MNRDDLNAELREAQADFRYLVNRVDNAALRRLTNGTRWTNEPLVVCGPGNSGSFSMLAKRKAIGHEVNASTRLGDRLVGTGYMPPS